MYQNDTYFQLCFQRKCSSLGLNCFCHNSTKKNILPCAWQQLMYI